MCAWEYLLYICIICLDNTMLHIFCLLASQNFALLLLFLLQSLFIPMVTITLSTMGSLLCLFLSHSPSSPTSIEKIFLPARQDAWNVFPWHIWTAGYYTGMSYSQLSVPGAELVADRCKNMFWIKDGIVKLQVSQMWIPHSYKVNSRVFPSTALCTLSW